MNNPANQQFNNCSLSESSSNTTSSISNPNNNPNSGLISRSNPSPHQVDPGTFGAPLELVESVVYSFVETGSLICSLICFGKLVKEECVCIKVESTSIRLPSEYAAVAERPSLDITFSSQVSSNLLLPAINDYDSIILSR